MSQEEIMQSMNEKLGAILRLLGDHFAVSPDMMKDAVAAVETVQAATVETKTKAKEIEEQPVSASEDYTPEVGDRVRYTGGRNSIPDGMGTVTEVKGPGWTKVVFDSEPSNSYSIRRNDLRLAGEQPPEVTEEEAEAAQAEADAAEEEEESPVYPGEITIDEEAAAYAIPQGMFTAYQNLHKIYTDSANADRNRKFLRYRAHNVLKGDEVTKEMCHRYLMSVRDEEYLKEVQ